MRSLQTISLREMLPLNLVADPFVDAFCDAFDDEFHRLVADTSRILLFALISEQPAEVLDHLAWQFNVDFYDQTMSLAAKRELISKALYWHSVKGTPRAVERVVEIVFGVGVVEEWFEYGSQPFHFRVRTAGGVFPTSEKLDRIIRMIEAVKRKSVLLETLQVEQSGQQSIFIGGAMQIGQHLTIAQAIRFPISPVASLIVGDLYFPLELAPEAFWTAVRDDGGDIRVFKQDGVTPCPCEVIGFDKANKVGSLFFAVNSGTAFYVCAGSGSAAPAVDSAYGKYNVWESALLGVWHLNDLSDATRNANHGTATGSITEGTGKIGKSKVFDSGAYLTTPASMYGLQRATFFFWTKRPTNSSLTVGCSDGDGSRAEVLTYSANSAYVQCAPSASSGYGIASSVPYGVDWHRFCAIYDGTQSVNADRVKLMVDGVKKTLSFNGTPLSTLTVQGTFCLNKRYTGSFPAEYDEVRLYNRALSEDEVSQLYLNQSAPAAFWTIGAAA